MQDKSRQPLNNSHLRSSPACLVLKQSHQDAGLAQQSDQSAFESNPVASKAEATSSTDRRKKKLKVDTEELEVLRKRMAERIVAE